MESYRLFQAMRRERLTRKNWRKRWVWSTFLGWNRTACSRQCAARDSQEKTGENVGCGVPSSDGIVPLVPGNAPRETHKKKLAKTLGVEYLPRMESYRLFQAMRRERLTRKN